MGPQTQNWQLWRNNIFLQRIAFYSLFISEITLCLQFTKYTINLNLIGNTRNLEGIVVFICYQVGILYFFLFLFILKVDFTTAKFYSKQVWIINKYQDFFFILKSETKCHLKKDTLVSWHDGVSGDGVMSFLFNLQTTFNYR